MTDHMNDAFSEGVNPGGLFSSQQIKVLVAYMLETVREPMTRDSVVEVICGNGMANYFEVCAAMDELVESGNAAELPDGLSLTEVGRESAQSLSHTLPFTIRDRAAQSALRLLTRRRREKDVDVSVQKQETGCDVTLCLRDKTYPMMTLTMRVADDRQAAMLEENFRADPALLYRSVVAILAGDAETVGGDKRIFINFR